MTLKQCIDFIRSDYYRWSRDKDASLLKIWRYSWLNDAMSYLIWFRLSKCDNPIIRGGARLRYRRLMTKYKIDIPRNAHIGYGFKLFHSGPIVINGTTRIGDNCDMHQYVSIGSTFNKAAIIGNKVFVGPGVCIVERINIGDGATIGAGAVVVKNVEPGITVAGNPAREVSHKAPGRLIDKKWDRAWNRAPIPEGY